MKKKASATSEPDEMPAEYKLDHSRAKPNRFAAELRDTIAVVLDPGVAAVFDSSELVNKLLRSVIAALPEKRAPRASPKKRAL